MRMKEISPNKVSQIYDRIEQLEYHILELENLVKELKNHY